MKSEIKDTIHHAATECTNDAISPMRSLFIYDGYRRVVVETDMMVDTSSLIWENVGLEMCSLGEKIILPDARTGYFKNDRPINCNPVQSSIIKNHDTIRILGQPSECEH